MYLAACRALGTLGESDPAPALSGLGDSAVIEECAQAVGEPSHQLHPRSFSQSTVPLGRID